MRVTSNGAAARIDAGKAAGMAVFHLAALLGFWTFTWQGLAAFLVLFVVAGQLGVSLGFHRLLCHRSYQAPAPLRYFFAVCGVLAFQGGPLTWCAIHRLHHRHSDTDEDPQMSAGPFWWSHVLWSVVGEMRGLATPADVRRVTADLHREPFLRLLERGWHAINAALALGLLLGGWLCGGWGLGLSLLVWGFFLRVVAVWHLTFLVNSVSHHAGYRNHETADNSRNSWWVALLTFGEGWHNNHHHQPRSAAHGHRWFEVDTTYMLIRAMEWLGLASHVVRPSASKSVDSTLPAPGDLPCSPSSSCCSTPAPSIPSPARG